MYSFEAVLVEIDNVIALKTLKNWADKIEKITDTRFERAYAKNIKGRKFSYKVFSSEDVQRFQRLVRLRNEKVPLNSAIISIFMSADGKEILVSEREFLEMKSDMKSLISLTKETLKENNDLKKKVLMLEK